METVKRWLPEMSVDGNNLEARTYMAYAIDILEGYTLAIVNTLLHYNIAQTVPDWKNLFFNMKYEQE